MALIARMGIDRLGCRHPVLRFPRAMEMSPLLTDYIVLTVAAVFLGAVLVYLIGAAIWHAGVWVIDQLNTGSPRP